MNRDEETEPALTGPPADERISSKPAAATGSVERSRRRRAPARPIAMANPVDWPRAPSAFSRLDTPPRRSPSHPAWENPPTPHNFPQLRGRDEGRRAIWPLLAAALAVVLVLGVLVVYPLLTGHRPYVAFASPSGTPVTSGSPNPGDGGLPSESPGDTATPAPSASLSASFKQYKVQSGDSATRVAKKYGLKTWELLAANPNLKPPSYTLRVGSYLNIPLPGQMKPPSASSASPAAPAAS